jgi:poly(3-hydroxybutyrate) depolymerase
MIYNAYQTYADIANSVRVMASGSNLFLGSLYGFNRTEPFRHMAAFQELFAFTGFTHSRPEYEIYEICSETGQKIPIMDDIISETPFCTLRRFSKKNSQAEPDVLLVAPMSGHFATLLRGTIQTLLRDHNVYITDWRNPRDVPLEKGLFCFDCFVEHIIKFIKTIGSQTHVVAVCQPAVQSLVAAAIMAEENDPDQPASLTLMAGPIDARIEPSAVNKFAASKSLEWFKQNMLARVPGTSLGVGRVVYPGFIQLSAFMSMNMERHSKAFSDFYHKRVSNDHEKADQIKEFYKEYFAIMDLDACFYLETIEKVFHNHELALGQLKYKGRPVRPSAIKKTFLLTVEGERDDICSVGQTLAAQDLCSGLRPYRKKHYMQPGVGHYGVFNGKRWDSQVYPVVREHIYASI